MDYYADTAFDANQHLTELRKPSIPASKEYFLLGKLGECSEYIACLSVSTPASWHDGKDKKKRRFTTKSQLKREKETHEKFFIKMAGDGPFFSIKLGLSALLGFYILLFSLPIQSYEFGGVPGLINCFKNPSYYYIVLGTYLAYRYCNWRACRAEDSYGVTLNRRTGMVEICNRKGHVRTHPFSNYEAVTRRQRMASGMGYHGSYMRNKKTGQLFSICNGTLLDGVITWTYIKNFMDISQPLPDIAEVEDFRHLDPVTKAHDEKSGRERHYWRNKTVKQCLALVDEARERAKKNFRY